MDTGAGGQVKVARPEGKTPYMRVMGGVAFPTRKYDVALRLRKLNL
jgi:hypothetical protein